MKCDYLSGLLLHRQHHQTERCRMNTNEWGGMWASKNLGKTEEKDGPSKMSTFTVQLTNQLTTRSWVFLDKPSVAQLLKNFLIIYGTRRLITVFTRALYWSPCWARWIRSILPHPLSLHNDAMSNAAVIWRRRRSCKVIRLIATKNVGKRHHSLFSGINLIWCACEKFQACNTDSNIILSVNF
jgi:hypothetical protein